MAAALSAGETTATGLAEAALARIAAMDAGIRAVVTLDATGARAAAVAADDRRARGRVIGALDGIPVAVKDNIAMAGLPRHAGTRAFPDPNPADATVTARLRAAGAVVLGTLNMHEGALGTTTDNPFWGRCDNPALPGHTPGGSSGGSAAAVAVGYVPIALGTDTMGSVRVPAAACGLWGLKPTRGIVSVTGLLPLSWTLDTIGPLAASVDDLRLAFESIVGFDAADPQSRKAIFRPGIALAAAVIAVPDEAMLADCDPAIRAGFETAAAAARAAGARVVPFTPAIDLGALRRAGLLLCEVEGAVMLGDEIAHRPEGFSAGFRAAIDYGMRATAPRLAQACRLLADSAALVARSMEGVDAVLMPTVPHAPHPHGQPAPAGQADFTALANVAGRPALALPVGAADGTVPPSVQLMGQPFGDLTLIDLARDLHERTSR